MLETRSWRWLRVRILGLLAVPAAVDMAGRLVCSTRLQDALTPPPPEAGRREEG